MSEIRKASWEAQCQFSVHGPNDSGEEHFRDYPLKTTVRETGQNSTDAPKDDGPVMIEIIRRKLPRAEFPDLDKYLDHFRKAKAFHKSEEVGLLCDTAISQFEDTEIDLLEFADYGTTGVSGNEDPKLTLPPWRSMIFGSGISEGSVDRSGSKGIGKYAPFSLSKARAVFYSTLTDDGFCAFQGVAHVPSYPCGGAPHRYTSIAIPYGIDGVDPITPNDKAVEVAGMFGRQRVGTSVFVIAPDIDDSEWVEHAARYLLESFFLLVLDGTLIATIRDETGKTEKEFHINENSIHSVADELEKKFRGFHVSRYITAYEEGQQIPFPNEQNKLGYLYLARDEKAPNHTVMTRNTGMVIKTRRINSKERYCGVFRILDSGIAHDLRTMENPNHDDWSHERHPDKKYAKQLLNDIEVFLKNQIAELGATTVRAVGSIPGLEKLLPDFFVDDPSGAMGENGRTSETVGDSKPSENTGDGGTGKNMEVELVPMPSSKRPFRPFGELNPLESEDEESNIEEEEEPRPDDNGPSPRPKPKPLNKRKHEIIPKRVKVHRGRSAIDENSGELDLSMYVQLSDAKDFAFLLYSVGEDGRIYKVRPSKAILLSPKRRTLKVNSDDTVEVRGTNGTEVIVGLSTATQGNYSTGVSLYELD